MKKLDSKYVVVMLGITFVVTFSVLHFFILPEDGFLKLVIISLGTGIGGVLGSILMSKRKTEDR